MATYSQTSQPRVAQTESQQSSVLRKFGTAMQTHHIDLRLSINQIETIVGCIAKSRDEGVTRYLPDANLAISNLRECLSTIQAQWLMFEIGQESLHGTGDRFE